MHHRSQILARIDYLQAELAALAALVRLGDVAPVESTASVAPTEVVEPEPVEEGGDESQVEQVADELPPEPEAEPKPRAARGRAPVVDPSTYTIDPAQAAQILGVARQTVDRRLKDGVKPRTPGAPVDTSKGGIRSRWRWASEDDVRDFWKAVG